MRVALLGTQMEDDGQRRGCDCACCLTAGNGEADLRPSTCRTVLYPTATGTLIKECLRLKRVTYTVLNRAARKTFVYRLYCFFH